MGDLELRKVLVIGGTGYVGTSLIHALLDEGCTVKALSRNPSQSAARAMFQQRSVTAIEGDITKPETLCGMADDVDVIYHLASISGGHPYTIEEVNIEGTRNVMAECAGTGALVIYASTTSVYGNSGEAIVEEGTHPQPNTVYSKSKLAAEGIVLHSAEPGGVVLRFGSVYGPGSPVIEDFLAKNGDVRVIGKGRNYANIIHIDDAVACLLAAGERGKPGEVYIATDGTAVRPVDFYGQMARCLGRGKPQFAGVVRLRILSSFFTFFGKLTGVPPIISTDTIRLLTNSIKASNRKLTESLGVSIQFADYSKGLEATFEETPRDAVQ